MSLGRVSQREGPIDERNDRSIGKPRPDMSLDLARDGRFLGAGPNAQGRSRDREAAAEDEAEINFAARSSHQADLHQSAFDSETFQVASDIVAADDVEDRMHARAGGRLANDL